MKKEKHHIIFCLILIIILAGCNSQDSTLSTNSEDNSLISISDQEM